MTQIQCPNCFGTGEQRLPVVYQTTYDELDSTWVPTKAIQDRLHELGDMVSITALAMRLAWLRDRGLARSRPSMRDHRGLEWRLG